MKTSSPGRAWPTLLFYVAAVFVLTKIAAAAVLVKDGAGALAFLAAVPGLWLDLLLWTLLWWVTWPFRKTAKLWVLLPFASAVALFSAGSWTSFLVTHTWMTWQRLRGDENVDIGDVGELEMSYALPMFTLMGLLLIAIAPALWLASKRKIGTGLTDKRVGLGALAAVAVLFLVDTQTAPWGLYGLSEQPLVAFVESIVIQTEEETDPLSEEEWERLHRPTAKLDLGPKPPKLAEEPKNLVVYLAEGIASKHTNFGGKYDTTPHIYRRWEDHGLWFDHFYTHTHRSIHAIFSVVCSEYPPPTLDAMTALHPRIDCGSLMETLDELEGMNQGLFHGGRFSFANKLALLAGRGFDVTEDAQDLSDKEKWEETWWGIDDRAVVDAALKFVDSVPEDERFFLMIIPIAPHEPYDVPRSAEVPKKIAKSTPGNRKYLRSVAFADQAFERLMKGLEERGRYDDTLTVWVPDHGNHADEPTRPSRGKRMLYQHNVHVPLVLLHEKSFSGERSHRLGAQIDLAPTMTAALGAPPDPKDRGVDLLSRSYKPRRVFLLKTRGNDPFVGLVDGDYKFIYDIRPSRWELYDLKNDPDERQNIASDHLARVRRYAKDGVKFRLAQRQTLLQTPALDEDVGTEADLFERAALTCEGGPCPKGVRIKADTCPGKWSRRPCLRVWTKKGTTAKIALPGDLVGRFDSVRVRWWHRERKHIKKTRLTLEYGGEVIPANPPWHRNDDYRVLPVPHSAAPGRPPVVLNIESTSDHGPVIEFVEH